MIKLGLISVLLALTAVASFGQEFRKFKDDGEVPRISIEEARKAFDDKSVVIIDARSPEIFKAEHIKGAINIPIGSSESEFDKLPKGKMFIVYCS